jgi:hypothetical protein
VIALDKPTAETSVDELTELVVKEYRRAREEERSAHQGSGPTAAADADGGPGAGER